MKELLKTNHMTKDFTELAAAVVFKQFMVDIISDKVKSCIFRDLFFFNMIAR